MDNGNIFPLDVWRAIINTPNDYNTMVRAWKWADKLSGFDDDAYWKRRFGYKFTCSGMREYATIHSWQGLHATVKLVWEQIINSVDMFSCDRNGPILVELKRNDLRIRVFGEGDHKNIRVTVDRGTEVAEVTEVTKYCYDDITGLFRIYTGDDPGPRWINIPEARKSTDPVIKSILCATNYDVDWTNDNRYPHFRM